MKLFKGFQKATSLVLVSALLVGGAGSIQADAAAKLKLSKKKLTLTEGGTATLTLKKGKKKVKKATWKSSNKTVATVSKGKVKAKSAGKAVITAKSGKKSVKCTVTVKAKASSAATNTTDTNTTTNTTTNTNTTTTAATSAPAANATTVPGTVVTNVPSAGTDTTSQPIAPPAGDASATPGQIDPPAPGDSAAPAPDESVAPASEATEAPAIADAKVEWTTEEDWFDGAYSYKDVEGNTQNEPVKLKREYVSFNPWPTTNAQVQYVINNCDDPFVMGALYVVALDNMEEPDNPLTDYTNITFDMLNSLQTGAGAINGSAYELSNYAMQHINEYYNKQIYTSTGETVYVRDFASRAYLKGATPYNNYTPESGSLTDKTTWKIIVDQYPYSCEQSEEDYSYIYDNPRWFTVCPERYTENQDDDGGEKTVNNHSMVLRLGFRWNSKNSIYLPTDYAKIDTDPGNSALEPYNIQASVLFSNDYMAPEEDQGW